MKSYPYQGTYSSYAGGGYQINLNNLNNMNLKHLQENNWIDQKTRAIFMEFALMNVNIDSFMYGVVLFEFLPSGNVIKRLTLLPLNLSVEAITNMASMSNLCNIIYLVFIIFYILKKLHKAFKIEKWDHFKNFWNYIDWFIIVFSIMSFTIWLYRLYASYNIFRDVRNKNSSIVNLQFVSGWNDLLSALLGLVSSLGFFKFLKLLKYNKNIFYIGLTFKMCAGDLSSFFLMFGIMFSAFAQIFYLIFSQDLLKFQSIISSIETCFEMMLGKFEVSI